MKEVLNLETINSHAEKLIDPKSELDDRTIDLRSKYPDIDYLLEWNGKRCFSIGDIQVIKGKAKSGKSTFLIGLMTALLCGEYMGFKAVKSECRILYFDTEQNKINTAKMIGKIHFLSNFPVNENHKRLKAINLRGDNPAERKRFIREAIEKYKPDLNIIDGGKDLIEGGDINSARDSTDTVQFLMAITKDFNVAILTLLHENKNDSNPRGHIGTELLNKCSEAWQITKSDKIFDVEQIENRNEPSGIIKVSFEINDENLPVLAEFVPRQSPKEKLWQEKVGSLYYCLKPGVRLCYTNLVEDYRKALGRSETTAQRDVGTFLKAGYLLKDDVSNEYRFNPEKVPMIIQNIPPSN